MKRTASSPTAPTVKRKQPKKRASDYYVLQLYVAGLSPNSSAAITNINKICEENLQGRYQLDVIDLYQQPQLAEGQQIIAIPTLVRKLPPPLRRIIGDLSNTAPVLAWLDIQRQT